MKFTPEHEALRQTWKTLIDREINPHVDEWEKAGIFPAHELFKKLGDANRIHLPVFRLGIDADGPRPRVTDRVDRRDERQRRHQNFVVRFDAERQ